MVHRFYDEYFFRPKAAWRVVSKAIINGDVKRLYHESKAFLKLVRSAARWSGKRAPRKPAEAPARRREHRGCPTSARCWQMWELRGSPISDH